MGLFLVGPMGAGKSAIGRELARMLRRPFFDSDSVIQERTGADIGFIFDREGEVGFRARERHVIDELTLIPDAVVATGGGAVLDTGSRDALVSRGTVVYLYTSIEYQLSRTRASTTRPLLDTADPADRLASLYAERDPLYRAIADFTVSTDGRRVRTVALEIVGLLKCND
ncbi:MAG: shikimate kinase AroK [Gammaproteobacteria bacterium]